MTQRGRQPVLPTWRRLGNHETTVLIFRLVFGLLLLGCVLCFAMSVGTGDLAWRRRGMLILKWALIAAAGFFGVLILERLAVML